MTAMQEKVTILKEILNEEMTQEEIALFKEELIANIKRIEPSDIVRNVAIKIIKEMSDNEFIHMATSVAENLTEKGVE